MAKQKEQTQETEAEATENVTKTSKAKKNTVTENYSYYCLKFSDSVPVGVYNFSIRPESWETCISLSEDRKFYTPSGRKVHDGSKKLKSVPNRQWLRLNDKQYKELEKFLDTKTASDCGIPEFPFYKEDTIIAPIPYMNELVEVDKRNPNGWEELVYGEYWLHLAHPLNKKEQAKLVIGSPYDKETKKLVNGLLTALINNSDLSSDKVVEQATK